MVLCDVKDSIRCHAAQLGERAKACMADITSSEQMQQAFEVAAKLSEEKGLAGVIHCAGVISVAKLVDREGNPADLDADAENNPYQSGRHLQRHALGSGGHGKKHAQSGWRAWRDY